MGNTNASATMFGFQFQANAAIYLMLNNITEIDKLRLEGATEDIELYMSDGKKKYAQAKAVVNGSTDFRNVRQNLKKAIKTLSGADSKDVSQLILITNSSNPLNEKKSARYFYGAPTERNYKDLNDEAKKIIDNIVLDLDVELNKDKFSIHYFSFETDNPRERYKVIKQSIVDFLNNCHITGVSSDELMRIWQNELYENGTKKDVRVTFTKNEIIWPIIVLALGNNIPTDFIDEYDAGTINEIMERYSNLINNTCERYEFITQVISDFNEYDYSHETKNGKEKTKKFINNVWRQYISELSIESLDCEIQEVLVKVVITKILEKRYQIKTIKCGVSL